jgi:hypothetical protein
MPVDELAAATDSRHAWRPFHRPPRKRGHCCPLGSDLYRLTTAAKTGTTSRSIARFARDEQFQTQFEVAAEPHGR